MPKNIKDIRLWDDFIDGGQKTYNNIKEVKIEFLFPCSWTTLHIEDLKKLLREWIKGEEQVYPLDKDVGQHTGNLRGRWMLFEEIKKVFNETESSWKCPNCHRETISDMKTKTILCGCGEPMKCL